jgi:hypothetical protein
MGPRPGRCRVGGRSRAGGLSKVAAHRKKKGKKWVNGIFRNMLFYSFSLRLLIYSGTFSIRKYEFSAMFTCFVRDALSLYNIEAMLLKENILQATTTSTDKAYL